MPSVLRHRRFRNLWFAAFGSSVGTWMESVGVQWVMAEWAIRHGGTGAASAPALMGYLAAAQLGPVLLLGLVGGLVADRVDRRRLLFSTQAVMMVIAAALALVSALDLASPAVLLSLGFLNGVASAFNIPAWQVVFPRLVPREELQKAITLNGMQFNFARVVGPALGGVMMAAWGPTVLFVINTLSFLGVLIAVRAVPPDGAREEPASPLESLRESFAFTFRNPGPRAVFIAIMLYSTLAVPVIRFLPLFASEVYAKAGKFIGKGEELYGLLLSILGAGAVLGGFGVRLIPRWYPKHHLLPLSVTLGGLAMAGFAFAGSLPWAFALLTIAGAFWLITFTTGLGAIQLLAPDAMRGRILSIFNTATFGATPIGALLMSVVGEFALRARHAAAPDAAPAALATRAGLAVQWGVGLAAIALVFFGALMLIYRTPEIDGLKPGDAGFERKPGFLRGLSASAHRPPDRPRDTIADPEPVAAGEIG